MGEHVRSRKLCPLPNENGEFKIKAHTHLAAQSYSQNQAANSHTALSFTVTSPLVFSSSSWF